jgi:hypothetical protein
MDDDQQLYQGRKSSREGASSVEVQGWREVVAKAAGGAVVFGRDLGHLMLVQASGHRYAERMRARC